MEKLDEILKMWEKDSVIDITEPGRQLLKIPELHSKYVRILAGHKVSSKKANFDYLRMKKKKWEYYNGKMSQEELEQNNWQPFAYKLKSDIPTYLEADNDLITLLEKKVYHDECISVVEAILGELKQRTWQLRSYIDYEKFIGGA